MKTCPKCEGSGLMNRPGQVPASLTGCDLCEGSGQIPSTRADIIREKTDEQLAEFFSEITPAPCVLCDKCTLINGNCKFGDLEDTEIWLRLLQQEETDVDTPD